MSIALSAVNNQNLLLSNNLSRQNSKANSALNKTVDNVSIGILTPEKTQALLNREIADKLQQRFKDEGIELKGLNADDFTPEKVSDRILSFVSGRILSADGSEKQNELMAQAREGIEQGFAQARDILDSLDALNGKVKTDIDSTYDLIQQGLDNLDKQINKTNVGEVNDNEVQPQNKVQQASMQSQFSREENTRIEITTTDGDKILIELFKQQSAQSLQRYSQNDEGQTYSQSRSLSASAGVTYQLQGELEQAEQQSIEQLLKDVSMVSEQFFSGNVQQAFKQAMDMGFDSQQLVSFSLNLNYQEQRQTAISTYSDVQSQAPVAEQYLEPSGLAEMSTFIQQVNALFQQPFVNNNMADGQQDVRGLLTAMKQLFQPKEMTQLQQDSGKLLDSLVQQLQQLNDAPV